MGLFKDVAGAAMPEAMIAGSAIRGVSNMATGITGDVERGKDTRTGEADVTGLGQHYLGNQGASIAGKTSNISQGIGTLGNVANNSINQNAATTQNAQNNQTKNIQSGIGAVQAGVAGSQNLKSQQMADQTNLTQQQMADRSRNISQFGSGLNQDVGQAMADRTQVAADKASTPFIDNSFNNVTGGIGNNSKINIGSGATGGGGIANSFSGVSGGILNNSSLHMGSMPQAGDMAMQGQVGGMGYTPTARASADVAGALKTADSGYGVLSSKSEDRAIENIGASSSAGHPLASEAAQLALPHSENAGQLALPVSENAGQRALMPSENSGQLALMPSESAGLKAIEADPNININREASGGGGDAAADPTAAAKSGHPLDDALAGSAAGAAGMYAYKKNGEGEKAEPKEEPREEPKEEGKKEEPKEEGEIDTEKAEKAEKDDTPDGDTTPGEHFLSRDSTTRGGGIADGVREHAKNSGMAETAGRDTDAARAEEEGMRYSALRDAGEMIEAASGGLLWQRFAEGGMVCDDHFAFGPKKQGGGRHKTASSFAGFSPHLGDSVERLSGGWTANQHDDLSGDIDMKSIWGS